MPSTLFVIHDPLLENVENQRVAPHARDHGFFAAKVQGQFTAAVQDKVFPVVGYVGFAGDNAQATVTRWQSHRLAGQVEAEATLKAEPLSCRMNRIGWLDIMLRFDFPVEYVLPLGGQIKKHGRLPFTHDPDLTEQMISIAEISPVLLLGFKVDTGF
jgi:hypothetical protein